MKIYITNILPAKLATNKIEHMVDNISRIIEINSVQMGTIIITDKNIYKIEPQFNVKYSAIKGYKCTSESDRKSEASFYDLLLDTSSNLQVPVISQFPSEYVLTIRTQHTYTHQNINGHKNKNDNKPTNKVEPGLKLIVNYLDDVVIDYYFELRKDMKFDITDVSIRSELDEFIRLLQI